MSAISNFLQSVFGKSAQKEARTEVSIPLGKLESVVCKVFPQRAENEGAAQACSRKWQAVADTIAKTAMNDQDRNSYDRLINNLEHIAARIKSGTNEHHEGVWVNREAVRQIEKSIPLIAEAVQRYVDENTKIQDNACYDEKVVGLFTRQPVRMVFEDVAIPRNILPIALTTFMNQFTAMHGEMNAGKGFDYGVSHIRPEPQKKGIPGRPYGMSR